jgi:hypothetical protein
MAGTVLLSCEASVSVQRSRRMEGMEHGSKSMKVHVRGFNTSELLHAIDVILNNQKSGIACAV